MVVPTMNPCFHWRDQRNPNGASCTFGMFLSTWTISQLDSLQSSANFTRSPLKLSAPARSPTKSPTKFPMMLQQSIFEARLLVSVLRKAAGRSLPSASQRIKWQASHRRHLRNPELFQKMSDNNFIGSLPAGALISHHPICPLLVKIEGGFIGSQKNPKARSQSGALSCLRESQMARGSNSFGFQQLAGAPIFKPTSRPQLGNNSFGFLRVGVLTSPLVSLMKTENNSSGFLCPASNSFGSLSPPQSHQVRFRADSLATLLALHLLLCLRNVPHGPQRPCFPRRNHQQKSQVWRPRIRICHRGVMNHLLAWSLVSA